MPNADGYITYSTKLDNSELVKDIQNTKKTIAILQKEIEKTAQKRVPLDDSVKSLGAQLDAAKAKLAALNAEKEKYLTAKAGYNINDPASIAAATEANAGLVGMDARIAAAEAEAAKLQAKFDKSATALESMDAKTATLNQNLASSKAQAAGLERQLAKAQSLAPLTDAVGAAEARVMKFGKRIGTMFRKVFMFSVLLAGLRAVRSWFSDIIKTNDEAVAAMGRLKGAVLTMAQPIVDVAIPAFIKLVNVLTQVVQVLANAMSLLFGRNVKDSAAAAKALNKEKQAIKGVGSAAKKAAGFLASFDEINRVQDTDTSGGGASTSGVEADFSGFNGAMVQSELDKLTAILGGALFAVGAILAFSGVNIPLGITLMALGAAILYKEAEQNWDKLPQQLQTAISGALVLVGMVALVVGLCLALSGTNIPLGLGLVAIGAASIAAAAALNWDEMGNTVAQKLAQIGTIIGPCIAVVGVFLLLTGNFPLGIAMIITGAAIFGVSEAVLNWDALGSTITEKLGNIASIVGGVLAALGVILMFTGVAFGIGLAMVIAGSALLIGGSIAAQWDNVPNTVRDKMALILKVIGGFLVVLGVILLFTGVGVPLGLGLVLAGAGLLGASAVAANWDFMTNKVKGCWESIKRYYNSNIKKYLSIDYWEGKASDIITGLCNGIRNGFTKLKTAVSDTINSAWNKVKSTFSGSSSSSGSTRATVSAQATSARIYSADVPELARGAVIPPNREFMAVLGDQRSGYNIEAPEELIRKIVREEAGGNDQTLPLLRAILDAVRDGKVMMLEQDVFARLVYNANKSESNRVGPSLTVR